MADSTCTGGAGASASSTTPSCPANGGAALEGATCVVLGNSKLIGGIGGGPKTGCSPAQRGAAASGNVTIASDVAVTGALSGGARQVRSLAWLESPGSANLGGPVTVNMRGAPSTGLQLFLDAGFGVTPVSWVETPYLGTAAPAYVASFVIGASGVLPLTFTVPFVPALSGRTFYLHALAIEPVTNAISLTNLGDLLLR